MKTKTVIVPTLPVTDETLALLERATIGGDPAAKQQIEESFDQVALWPDGHWCELDDLINEGHRSNDYVLLSRTEALHIFDVLLGLAELS